MKYQIKTKDLSDLWELISDKERHRLSEYAKFLQDFANKVLLDAKLDRNTSDNSV